MDNEKFVMDTVGQAFFESELKYLAERTYDRMYPALTARSIFPVASNFDPGAQTVAFRSYSRMGKAKILADGALDVPTVDVAGAEVNYPVKTVGMGFNYTDLELIRAQQTKVRLDEKRAFAAREEVETTINDIAFNGAADYGLPGLFSDSDIGSHAAVTGTWPTTATAAQIRADIVDWYNRYVDQCGGAETPNTIALAPLAYARLAITPINDYTDTTFLQWLRTGGIEGINSVVSCPDCAAVAGFSSSDVGIMYTKDSSKLELKIPAEVKIFPPQAKGLGYHVAMYARVSGLFTYYPKSVFVLTGLED
jgi:hypothetical protein